MRDLPILFSAPMVRALLAGTKTQTRRSLNPQPYPLDGQSGFWNASGAVGGRICISDRALLDLHHKANVGDRLYVREHWHAARSLDRTPPRDIPRDASVEYVATKRSYAEIGLVGKHRQAMHMPRWASRITLLVDDVKVERLQSISEEDALAEGVPDDNSYAGSFEEIYCRRCGGSSVHGAFGEGYGVTEVDCAECETAVMRYRNLWDHINGEGAWAANPWVVAYSFKVVLENIDYIGRAAA